MKIYMGIDPGFTGAIATVTHHNAWCWDMPLVKGSKRTELDFLMLSNIMRWSGVGEEGVAGLEWNTTRPDNEPERAYRFGLQTGALAMGLTVTGVPWQKVSPQAWKNHYNIQGKEKDPHSVGAQEAWRGLNYPEHDLIYGPKGGILDGRLDALLIAVYVMRQHEPIQPLEHGGLAAMKAVLTSGPRGRPGGRNLPRI
jgi:hypothetical protein